jgi:oligo-1,6-glucosidase
MVFQFEHVALDHTASKWDMHPLDLRDLKASFGRWQAGLADVGWNSLYWDNHDQPRIVSRWGDGSPLSAKTLGTLLHLHRGTPYVYQGEELGMTNYPWSGIGQFRDIESINHYADAVARGADPELVLAGLREASRDNARTPMQWDASANAGFTTGTPWLPVNPNLRRDQRGRPAGRPGLGARALQAADRAAARGARRSRSATSPCCCRTDRQVYAFTRRLEST